MSITAINDFFNIIILLIIRVINYLFKIIIVIIRVTNYLFNIIIVIIRVIIAAQFIVEIDGQLPPYSSHTLRNDADEEYGNGDENGELDAFFLVILKYIIRNILNRSVYTFKFFSRYPSWGKNVFWFRKVFINFFIVTAGATSSCWVSIRSEFT